ncbi:MAG: hypothetical protein U5K76_09750 [Woeseiaceae bacterium]|nr:hypothetical protein [Woeseiaceae bacterium]
MAVSNTSKCVPWIWNASDPTGINQHVMRFMEAFLVYCLLEDSPPLDDADWDRIAANHELVAKRGRQPDLQLARNGEPVELKAWADEIMQGVGAVAGLLDPPDSNAFSQSVGELRKLVADPDATPSARLLRELQENGSSFFEFALDAARGHRDYFNELGPMPAARYRVFAEEAASSLERQRSIEAADDISFDEYLEAYYTTG